MNEGNPSLNNNNNLNVVNSNRNSNIEFIDKFDNNIENLNKMIDEDLSSKFL